MRISKNGQMLIISWNKEIASEVVLARKKMKEYTRQGWLAFRTISTNEKIPIYDFDTSLEKILLVPIAHGG